MTDEHKELPPHRLWQQTTAKWFAVIFGASLAYAVIQNAAYEQRTPKQRERMGCPRVTCRPTLSRAEMTMSFRSPSTYLRDYRTGDTAAIDTLFARVPSLREVVKNEDQPTPEDLRAIEERLLFIIRFFAELRTQLQPALELYWQQHREVDEMEKTYNATLRTARVAIIAWDRGHQRLAAGVTEPAEIDLIGIARDAATAAIR